MSTDANVKFVSAGNTSFHARLDQFPMTHKIDPRHPLARLKSSLSMLHERHRDRHRPTGFGFAFADRIAYLDPLRWDAVTAQASIFLRRDVLQVIEQHGPGNIQPRYAIIFREDKAVAVLAAQIVTVTGKRLRREPQAAKSHSSSGLLRRVLTPAVNVVTAGLRERMVVAGNLLSWGFHGVGFVPGEVPEKLWPEVAEALYRIRRAERLTGQANLVMVKDVTPAQTGLEALHRFSYRPMETEPNMVLRLDPAWRNYEHYLAALDAKYRRNAPRPDQEARHRRLRRGTPGRSRCSCRPTPPAISRCP